MYDDPTYSDTTEYQRPRELMQAVYRNPYEPPNPYSGDVPLAPPSPPKQRRTGLIVALVYISCIAIIIGGVFIAMFYQHNQEPMTSQNYTARDILHDLNKAGVHPKFVEYNNTIWSWTADTYTVSANATSSVNFGIWVYDDPTTAMQAFDEVLNDEHQPNASIPMMGIPTPTLHGRCLLLSNSDQSIYGQVVMQYFRVEILRTCQTERSTRLWQITKRDETSDFMRRQ